MSNGESEIIAGFLGDKDISKRTTPVFFIIIAQIRPQSQILKKTPKMNLKY